MSFIDFRSLTSIVGGNVVLGKADDFPSFGWDNEYGQRSYEIPPFSAGKFMVTNGEYHEFVLSGGYSNRELWTAEGWAWRAY
eukprot:15707-Heterococcus_DN1.PRE.1